MAKSQKTVPTAAPAQPSRVESIATTLESFRKYRKMLTLQASLIKATDVAEATQAELGTVSGQITAHELRTAEIEAAVNKLLDEQACIAQQLPALRAKLGELQDQQNEAGNPDEIRKTLDELGSFTPQEIAHMEALRKELST